MADKPPIVPPGVGVAHVFKHEPARAAGSPAGAADGARPGADVEQVIHALAHHDGMVRAGAARPVGVVAIVGVRQPVVRGEDR